MSRRVITYIQNNYPEILSALVEHLWLALIPIVVGARAGAAARLPRRPQAVLYQPVVNVGAIIYSIPSLALFLMIPAIIGIGSSRPLNVLVGLSLYTLALLTRTVADALISVQGETTQAARALGFRPLRQLFGVELPMAAPVLFAGLRVATVANISLVSVGALVGSAVSAPCSPAASSSASPSPSSSASCSRCCSPRSATSALVLLQRRLTPWTRAGGRA